MSKKVSCIIPLLGSGGAERVMSYIANYLDDKGYDVTIYTFISDEESYKINDSVKHINVEINHKSKIISKIMRVIKMRKLLRNDGSETVIAFDKFTGITSALFMGKKVIASERNDPYSNMKKNSFWDIFRGILYRLADTVVFQTKYAQGYFSEKIKKHSVIIPNPIPDNLPEPYENEREKKIVAACRLSYQKNIPMMASCVLRFLKEYPDYKFYIYGQGDMQEPLKDFIDKNDIQDRFIMGGYTTDLYNKIIDASMYISTSNFEGISNSMLEALALGIPTICTDCPAGGAALAISSGENGILVPVGDREAMFSAMKFVADNPKEAEKMSKNAVKIRDKWSAEKICAEWEKIL